MTWLALVGPFLTLLMQTGKETTPLGIIFGTVNNFQLGKIAFLRALTELFFELLHLRTNMHRWVT